MPTPASLDDREWRSQGCHVTVHFQTAVDASPGVALGTMRTGEELYGLAVRDTGCTGRQCTRVLAETAGIMASRVTMPYLSDSALIIAGGFARTEPGLGGYYTGPSETRLYDVFSVDPGSAWQSSDPGMSDYPIMLAARVLAQAAGSECKVTGADGKVLMAHCVVSARATLIVRNQWQLAWLPMLVICGVLLTLLLRTETCGQVSSNTELIRGSLDAEYHMRSVWPRGPDDCWGERDALASECEYGPAVRLGDHVAAVGALPGGRCSLRTDWLTPVGATPLDKCGSFQDAVAQLQQVFSLVQVNDDPHTATAAVAALAIPAAGEHCPVPGRECSGALGYSFRLSATGCSGGQMRQIKEAMPGPSDLAEPDRDDPVSMQHDWSASWVTRSTSHVDQSGASAEAGLNVTDPASPSCAHLPASDFRTVHNGVVRSLRILDTALLHERLAKWCFTFSSTGASCFGKARRKVSRLNSATSAAAVATFLLGHNVCDRGIAAAYGLGSLNKGLIATKLVMMQVALGRLRSAAEVEGDDDDLCGADVFAVSGNSGVEGENCLANSLDDALLHIASRSGHGHQPAPLEGNLAAAALSLCTTENIERTVSALAPTVDDPDDWHSTGGSTNMAEVKMVYGVASHEPGMAMPLTKCCGGQWNAGSDNPKGTSRRATMTTVTRQFAGVAKAQGHADAVQRAAEPLTLIGAQGAEAQRRRGIGECLALGRQESSTHLGAGQADLACCVSKLVAIGPVVTGTGQAALGEWHCLVIECMSRTWPSVWLVPQVGQCGRVRSDW
ncbi:hypothetical protein GQ54DRAFT_300963 [Martensiomyces pterosporus]|nr:hypothetical protein GQ54DRAFT_300963 [Martensiomyces pterosporus]